MGEVRLPNGIQFTVIVTDAVRLGYHCLKLKTGRMIGRTRRSNGLVPRIGWRSFRSFPALLGVSSSYEVDVQRRKYFVP
jgi:hypothetical protein